MGEKSPDGTRDFEAGRERIITGRPEMGSQSRFPLSTIASTSTLVEPWVIWRSALLHFIKRFVIFDRKREAAAHIREAVKIREDEGEDGEMGGRCLLKKEYKKVRQPPMKKETAMYIIKETKIREMEAEPKTI